MKKHSDLLAVLRSNKMRITPARRALLQFILDNSKRQIGLSEIQTLVKRKVPGTDRSSIYRNLEMLKSSGIIQELQLPREGRCFQYIFDGPVRHFYFCRSCGKSHRGNMRLFKQIEAALKRVRGFSRANLSTVFYGYCSSCKPGKK